MLGKRILTLTSGSDHFFQFMVSAARQASRKYELKTAHSHALSIDVLEVRVCNKPALLWLTLS